jgi:hypothetical protein
LNRTRRVVIGRSWLPHRADHLGGPLLVCIELISARWSAPPIGFAGAWLLTPEALRLPGCRRVRRPSLLDRRRLRGRHILRYAFRIPAVYVAAVISATPAAAPGSTLIFAEGLAGSRRSAVRHARGVCGTQPAAPALVYGVLIGLMALLLPGDLVLAAALPFRPVLARSRRSVLVGSAWRRARSCWSPSR